jgi:hypothetical protein
MAATHLDVGDHEVEVDAGGHAQRGLGADGLVHFPPAEVQHGAHPAPGAGRVVDDQGGQHAGTGVFTLVQPWLVSVMTDSRGWSAR